VTVLAIFQVVPGHVEAWNIFARRHVGVIHGQVIGVWRGAKRNRRQMQGLVLAIEPRNEWNDFRIHDNASHTTIASKPVTESDIR
jgi:hypothetical protein